MAGRQGAQRHARGGHLPARQRLRRAPAVTPYPYGISRKYLLTFLRQEPLPMLRCPGLPGFS
jgi:hypothetical protein